TRDATQFDALAENGGLVGDELTHGLAIGGSGLRLFDGRSASRGHRGEHLLGEGDELLVLRDEVGLADELDQRRRSLALSDGDEALARLAVAALGDALE